MAIVTVEEAADHLRIVLQTDESSPATINDLRYNDLVNKLAQAEALVLDYIEKSEADLTASGVSANWLPVVKAAVLLILSGLWDDRVGTDQGDFFAENGAVARLLRRIRYSAIA